MSREVSVQLTPCSPPWRLWDDALLYLGSRVELVNEKLAKIESFCFNFFILYWGIADYRVGNGNPLQYSWRIPWTEESGRLQSIGLKRVRHDCLVIRLST